MQPSSLAQPPSFQMKAHSQSRVRLVWQKNPKDHLFQTRKLELAGKKERVSASPASPHSVLVLSGHSRLGGSSAPSFSAFCKTPVRGKHKDFTDTYPFQSAFTSTCGVLETGRFGSIRSLVSDMMVNKVHWISSQGDSTSAHRSNGEFFLKFFFFFEIKWYLAVGKT